MWSRLWALVLLGTALVWTLLKRLWPGPDPVVRFEETFGEEGILGVQPSEHRELVQPGRCTACGLCDGALDETRGPAPSVMHFVLAGTRSMPDYSIARDLLDDITDSELEQAERLCPFDVRIVPLAQLVRGHAARHD